MPRRRRRLLPPDGAAVVLRLPGGQCAHGPRLLQLGRARCSQTATPGALYLVREDVLYHVCEDVLGVSMNGGATVQLCRSLAEVNFQSLGFSRVLGSTGCLESCGTSVALGCHYRFVRVSSVYLGSTAHGILAAVVPVAPQCLHCVFRVSWELWSFSCARFSRGWLPLRRLPPTRASCTSVT